jgi:hypothetical protein
MTNDLGPGFCGTCGETFDTTTALDAHQLETGHEMDQEDHPLRLTARHDRMNHMASSSKPKQRRPSLGTDCRCGHTYNWHIPGDVCRVPGCVCKEHVTRNA